MKSSTNHLNPLLKSHQLLEQNEDTIASIVENLQLGRLDNCLVQYSSLLSNLISLSLEFDSYPAEDEHEDFSEIVCQFPDALMRKDLLDDMRTPDMMFTPDPPVTPPCTQCALSKRTAFQCRVEAGHIAPHNKFTSAELRDFLCATEVLAQQHGEYNVEKLKSKHKTKKTYKRWNSMEKYTVMLAIARSGSKEVSKVLASVENRTENQVGRFVLCLRIHYLYSYLLVHVLIYYAYHSIEVFFVRLILSYMNFYCFVSCEALSTRTSRTVSWKTCSVGLFRHRRPSTSPRPR